MFFLVWVNKNNLKLMCVGLGIQAIIESAYFLKFQAKKNASQLRSIFIYFK
jgi:hypothetical protein